MIEVDSKTYCPRVRENGVEPGQPSPFKSPFNGEATWRKDDNTCSYCGSINPEVFLQRIEDETCEVIPTDKSYKAYVRNLGGAAFLQTYRNCPQDAKCSGPDDCTHWVTREIDQTKFYFQHLSKEQQDKFIELHNAKKMKFGHPGGFYVKPFFCQVVGPA